MVSLEALAVGNVMETACRQRIVSFFRQAPEEAVFARRLFRREQFYRIESRAGRCILYAKGRRSYAELLLEAGLGIIAPGFDDIEWNDRFERAQQGARRSGRGIWRDPLWGECVDGF